MRIAKLNMDAQDKTRFEIQGKSSVKYHLKANHVVEAKRWFWALNNAIQWAKDEAKEDDKRRTQDAEALRQAKMDQAERQGPESQADSASLTSAKGNLRTLAPSSLGVPSTSGSKLSLQISRGTESGGGDDETSAPYPYGHGQPQLDINKISSHATTHGDTDMDEDYADYTSSREITPSSKDAFSITSQSVKLQLDLLGSVSTALETEKSRNPSLTLADPAVSQALTTYERAVNSLNALVVDLLKISRDRDAYWQYRLDREADARKMWEDSMARVAREHEELQNRIGESEDKRKRTKKALKEALGNASTATSGLISQGPSQVHINDDVPVVPDDADGKQTDIPEPNTREISRRRSTLQEISGLSDDESDEEDEFFDAIDAGEVEIISPPVEEVSHEVSKSDLRVAKESQIATAFKGYEDSVRLRLKLDADDRPKISLWVMATFIDFSEKFDLLTNTLLSQAILKSMIGKDMTKMTLPVSFNEPTSLLQRVAEDMEYTDLLDIAADRADSLERMIYVAAFAASEYASTIGRVAKPFNPLLGETYEYVRPDKNYRFFVEQVSHHPPIGAAYAESPKWDYYVSSPSLLPCFLPWPLKAPPNHFLMCMIRVNPP